MRSLFVSCFLFTFALTGCSLFGEIHTPTQPINPVDLTTKFSFKYPQQSKSTYYFKQFKDPQLDQLIAVALADAPNMRIARARIARMQQLTKIAYSSLWPFIGASGYVEKAYFPIHGHLPPPINSVKINQATIADVGLKFNYELDFWGKNRENIASRLNETVAAQMDLAHTQLVLSAAVATTYFEVQNSMLQYRLAQENSRLLRELADIIVARERQGIESNIPVRTALANAQAAVLSIEDYRRAQMQARHQLAVLMGKNPLNTQIDTAPFLYDKNQLKLPEILPANLLAQRPDIIATRALTEAAAHQVNVAKTAFFPNINLKGLLSIQSFYFNKAFNFWLENDNATAAFDLPIFDAGARKANLRANYAQYEVAVNQYNQTILNSLQQVGDQLSSFVTLDAQIKGQKQALYHFDSNYKSFRARYKQGIIDYIQVLEIKQLLVQQTAILHQLQNRQKQAYVGILTALGGAL
ncbi:efflux transporter outer membrane subunit [Legionella wadsworthii]|uniref:efflux transporter outer membrane subunit n=1 Tax=Legionella wadsworthii TaxID=28088 RepID=UPI0004E0FFB9|nr:efflux transporter outer membrane subunit [Legionella wadsworthii]